MKLGQACLKIGSGTTPCGGKNTYLTKGPYAFIRSQNVYNNQFSYHGLVFITNRQAKQLNNVKVLENDILLNITGDSVARVCQVPADILPARVNQHVMVIRPDPKLLDYRFVRYYLLSPKIQAYMLMWASMGATRKALTKAMIETLEVPSISLSQQKAAVEILSALDSKIENNRYMSQTLEAIAYAIFKSWFVDFEPVRAKASGNQPAYMDAQTSALFPDRFNEDGLPQGWWFGRVCDLGKILTGKTPSTKIRSYYGDAYPFIKIPDMNRMWVTRVGSYLSEQGSASQVKKLVPAGAVLVSCIATPGITAISSEPSHFNQQINAVIPSLEYGSIWTYFSLQRLRSDIEAKASSGSVIPNLNKKEFSKLSVTMCASEIITAFTKQVKPLVKKILENDKENRLLSDMRDILLPKLIFGETSVKDAECVASYIA